jgi:hypothetical protein
MGSSGIGKFDLEGPFPHGVRLVARIHAVGHPNAPARAPHLGTPEFIVNARLPDGRQPVPRGRLVAAFPCPPGCGNPKIHGDEAEPSEKPRSHEYDENRFERVHESGRIGG